MEDAKKQTKAEDLKGSECQGQEQDPQETQGTQDIQNTQDPQDQDNQDQGAKDEEPDWKDRYARAMADFDNFRKRTARDREDLVKFAAADVLKDILPTVDNLARALNEATDKEDDPFVAGVKLVYDGLVKALADHGATPLDSVGEPFDANFHEALAQLPSEDVEEGHVMSEVKRGWMLHGKLLRAAQVVVSAGKKA
jgi:molecular chaperone GrpE